jgi:hypothetical protein
MPMGSFASMVTGSATLDGSHKSRSPLHARRCSNRRRRRAPLPQPPYKLSTGSGPLAPITIDSREEDGGAEVHSHEEDDGVKVREEVARRCEPCCHRHRLLPS